ncbi:MAG: EAL domain-containing protein [Treponema sp.]|nr:EAL domain-containing protein [Treponema sp.]
MHYIYQYDFIAIFISLSVLINFFYKKTVSTKVTRNFALCIIMLLISSTFDLISVYTLANSQTVPLIVNYIVNQIFFISLYCIPPLYFSCVIFGIEEKSPVSVIIKRAMFFPYLFCMIAILSTPWTRWVFYFDEALQYKHGSLFLVLHTISFIYLLLCLTFTFLKNKILSRNQISTISLYVFFSIVAVIIQLILPQYLVTNFIASITIFITYFSFENPSVYKDTEMGIYNISAFYITINSLFKKKKKNKILAFQIIGTKYLDDTIGLENTSQLMKTIARYLQLSAIRLPLYRLSRTRFVFVLPDDSNKLNQLVDRINVAFSEPFRIGDFKLSISVRFVTLNLPEDARNLDDTIDLIEKSLKTITDKPSGTIIKADKNIIKDKIRNEKILSILQTAVKEQDFSVVYQPVYSIKKGKFTILEALVRLNNNELGYISPKDFIPLAEQNGLINQIGMIVIRKVCQFISMNKIWERGIDYVQINLSVIQCMQNKLYKDMLKVIEEFDLDYRLINFEVTETAILASSQALLNNMNQLKQKQIFFSLDDFGTTFNNIKSLIDYPFKTIKLEKEMVRIFLKDEKIAKILTNIVKMANSLDIEVIAEGVETVEQFENIEKMGCSFVQGFYYSKPVKEIDLLEIIR